ncbi:MAG: McrC family protein [Clostridiaceae bacterium]
MSKKYYVISEYGYIANRKYTNHVDKGAALVDNNVFEELENFVIKNKDSFEKTQAGDFLSISYKRRIGKIIKAQNYVGIIQTRCGTTIEILPKIYNETEEICYEKTLKIFIKMLKYLKDTPFKKFNLSSVNISNMNLLEVFINMFLEELGLLIKKGVKSNYILREDNLYYYKGKLDINKHIRNNIVNKERFYLQFDEYSKNTAENRIIKSTLLLLKLKTNRNSLQKSIRKYLFILDEITPSYNIKGDFSKCINNRMMSEYDNILRWCRIFLDGKSFLNYKGDNIAYSLLFPMEKVFENYVAKQIKNHEGFKDCKIYTQHSKYYLLENPKLFKLKPDIVMEKGNTIIILDTKWKLLKNDLSLNYGISQSDLYQMYAYVKKYNSKNVILLYPMNGYINEIANDDIYFFYEDKIKLSIFFVDLEDTKHSMDKLDTLICNNNQ